MYTHLQCSTYITSFKQRSFSRLIALMDEGIAVRCVRQRHTGAPLWPRMWHAAGKFSAACLSFPIRTALRASLTLLVSLFFSAAMLKFSSLFQPASGGASSLGTGRCRPESLRRTRIHVPPQFRLCREWCCMPLGLPIASPVTDS